MSTSNDIKAKQHSILKCPTVRWDEIRVIPIAEFSYYFSCFFDGHVIIKSRGGGVVARYCCKVKKYFEFYKGVERFCPHPCRSESLALAAFPIVNPKDNVANKGNE